jgi:hypothetical protein
MILMSLALVALGTGDLVRWSPNRRSVGRDVTAFVCAVAISVAFTRLSGLHWGSVTLLSGLAALAVLGWIAADYLPIDLAPTAALPWLSVILVVAFAAAATTHSIGGDLKHWYAGLPAPLRHAADVDRFAMAVAATCFSLATANRVVRLILQAAGTPASTGEQKLKGGRLLGPMERLIVGGLVLSGSAAGAGIVIAAKGLIRLPELRRETSTPPPTTPGERNSETTDQSTAPDQISEYFLVGTLSSMLVAALLALLVRATT